MNGTLSRPTAADGAGNDQAAARGAFRWMRIPLGCVTIVEPDGRLLVCEEEIGTPQAARIIGCRVRTVQRLCDEGILAEGLDWRRLPGRGRGGKLYRIKARSAVRLRYNSADRPAAD